jgi:hypothetical protein
VVPPRGAAEIAFDARAARLLRWGWPRHEAEATAHRLARRDREGDGRVLCCECRHYRPGRCGNAERAGLASPHLSADLAGLLQHCNGFNRQ